MAQRFKGKAGRTESLSEVLGKLTVADLRDRLEKEGSEVLGSAPKDFGAHIVNEVQMWGKVIREAGIQAN